MSLPHEPGSQGEGKSCCCPLGSGGEGHGVQKKADTQKGVGTLQLITPAYEIAVPQSVEDSKPLGEPDYEKGYFKKLKQYEAGERNKNGRFGKTRDAERRADKGPGDKKTTAEKGISNGGNGIAQGILEMGNNLGWQLSGGNSSF